MTRLLQSLDDQCRLGDRGSDEEFAQEIGQKHTVRGMCQLEQRGTFSITHYAGKVLYTAEGFVLKNSDAMHADSQTLMRQYALSSDPRPHIPSCAHALHPMPLGSSSLTTSSRPLTPSPPPHPPHPLTTLPMPPHPPTTLLTPPRPRCDALLPVFHILFPDESLGDESSRVSVDEGPAAAPSAVPTPSATPRDACDAVAFSAATGVVLGADTASKKEKKVSLPRPSPLPALLCPPSTIHFAQPGPRPCP